MLLPEEDAPEQVRVQNLKCKVQDAKVRGARFKVLQGAGCRLQSAGFRVQGAERKANLVQAELLEVLLPEEHAPENVRNPPDP